MLTLAILNYNGLDTLQESITSVLQQHRKPDRFVIIDNASTDASRQIAVDMGIEVVDADNRHKFITGLNKAISLNEDLLFFMQNDVALDEWCLEYMIQDCPEFNFIAQPVIYQTDGKIDNAGMDIIWPGYGWRRHNKWWDGAAFEECGLVTTICFLTDNKYIGYDERFQPAYYEDLDFALRSQAYKHVLIPAAKAIHKGNHTFSQTLKKKEISAICRKNRKKLIRKHYHGIDKWVRLAVTTGLDIAKKTIDVIRCWRIFPNKRE